MFEPKPHLEPSYGPREWLDYPETETQSRRSKRPLFVIGGVALALVGFGVAIGLIVSSRTHDE